MDYSHYPEGGLAVLQWGFVLVASVLFILFDPFSWLQRRSKLPLVNFPDKWELTSSRVKWNFVTRARQLIAEGLKTHSSFLLMTDTGPRLILSADYVNDIKGHPNLSFGQFVNVEFLPDYSGLQAYKQSTFDDKLVQQVARTKLTNSLAAVTKPLSDEARLACSELFGESREWSDIRLKDQCSFYVARLSSRVFLGPKLCRDPRFLSIQVSYTNISQMAIGMLKQWPALLRPIVHWFLPMSRKTREHLKTATRLINEEVVRRRQEKAEYDAKGETVPKYNDALEWFEECAKGRKYEPAFCQLGLSVAAIHTTTDLIAQTIFNLAEHPEIIEPLRKEIIEVLSENGWEKTSLSKLKLLDSVLKETQRLKPPVIVSMSRRASAEVEIRPGITVPKDGVLHVSLERMWSEEVHSEPEVFDGYRFLKLREQPGGENTAQLVTTSPDHLAFGHGTHSCPGRFFAANELKIALCHFIMKYDFRLPSGVKPQTVCQGIALLCDPVSKLSVRRRNEEISIDNL